MAGDRAGRHGVLARLLAVPFVLGNPLSQQARRLGLVTVLNWLETQAGGTLAAAVAGQRRRGQQDWRSLLAAWKAARSGASPGRLPPHIGGGLMLLICGDVIRPGTGWLLRCSPTPRNLAAEMARPRDPGAFVRLEQLCQAASVGSYTGWRRWTRSRSSWRPRAARPAASPSATAPSWPVSLVRLLLTDVTVTRTSDTITAHVRLADGQACALTLPVPELTWKIRKTKASTIAEIDKLLDHHTCAEIAAIRRCRGLPNGEGRQFTPTMVQRVIRTYQLPGRRQRLLDAGLIPLSQMAALLGVSTGTVKIWYHAGIVSRQRYNDKAMSSTTRPGPTCPPATKDADTTPCDLHEHHLATNHSEAVQYTT